MFGTVWTLAWALPKEISGWLLKLPMTWTAALQGRWVALRIGGLWTTGRRSLARWLAALAPSEHWSRFYYLFSSVGRKISRLLRRLAAILLVELCPSKQVVLILDDTVLRRYGPKVQGSARCIAIPRLLPAKGPFVMDDRGCRWPGRCVPRRGGRRPSPWAASWDRSGRTVSDGDRRNVLLCHVLERPFSLVHRLDLINQKILGWICRLLALSHCTAPP